jgi:hypothetical protein
VVRQHTASLAFTVPSFAFDALNDTTRAGLVALDSLGVPVQAPRITFSSSDTAAVLIDSTGLLRARGNGSATIQARALSGVVATVPAAVAQQVTRVTVARDTVAFDALHARLSMRAMALDRLGSPVAGATLKYVSENDSIALVDPTGQIEARSNGTTRVVSIYGADTGGVVARVQQRAVRIVTGTDTVRLGALGDTQGITATAVDSLGSSVTGALSSLSVADTSVAQALDSVTVKAITNGSTAVHFAVAGVTGTVVVVVRQIAASINATLDSSEQIASLPLNSVIPITCRVWDRNGHAMSAAPSVLPSSGNRWTGSACNNLRIQRSGLDTVQLVADTVRASLAIALAVRPTTALAVGAFLTVDSMPTGTFPWAPSARLTQGGTIEIYSSLGDVTGATPRSSLHRFVSLDGVTFAYDGLVLSPDADSCGLDGTGIENVAIVQRSDAPGWRMFYAGGSNDCYGWQVLSAVSLDGRVWAKEPGVRLRNGGPLPPDAPLTPPWPVGEGMVVEQLPSGDWRMLAGSYEHVVPTEEKWQIAEWRSSDQLTWSYVGTVLTTRDMPLEGQGSVYSPTLAQIGPGLWRMIFTADNRGTGQAFQSSLWSAVSLDKEHWQLEGQLMGAQNENLYYSALVGDRLVFIRQEPEQSMRLGIATIQMP